MWKFKSPINGEPLLVDTYIHQCYSSKFTTQEVQKTYELLTYIFQKDQALITFAQNYGFDLPYKLFTFDKNQINFLKEHSEIKYEENYFLKSIADKFERKDKIAAKFSGKIDDFLTLVTWEYFIPKELISGYYSKLKIEMDFYKHSSSNEVYEKYYNYIEKLYEEQQALAHLVFSEIDEHDKISLNKIYNYFKNLMCNPKKIIDDILSTIEGYNELLNEFPLIKDDIYLLLNEGKINENKPYIKIIDNKYLLWNSTDKCLSQYLGMLHLLNDKNDNKNVKWKLIEKTLFNNKKKSNLKTYINKEKSPDLLILLAKSKIFNYSYKEKILSKLFDNYDIDDIKQVNMKLLKNDEIECFIYNGIYLFDDKIYKFN